MVFCWLEYNHLENITGLLNYYLGLVSFDDNE